MSWSASPSSSAAAAAAVALDTALDVAECRVAAAGAARGAMRFGPFPITETTATFPPPGGPSCYVYVTLNAEIALSWADSEALRQLVRSGRARVSVDGQWLWWALRRRYPRQPLVKLSGSDLVYRLAQHCAEQGRRLLLVGSSPERNALAVQRLAARWPGLEVSGWAPPAFQAASSEEQATHAAVGDAIVDARADHVVLGLGAGKEHRLAAALAARLDGRVQGLFCFGGAIDFASGAIRRAPLAWQRAGLEGLYRVWQCPARAGRLLRVLRILPVLASGRY